MIKDILHNVYTSTTTSVSISNLTPVKIREVTKKTIRQDCRGLNKYRFLNAIRLHQNNVIISPVKINIERFFFHGRNKKAITHNGTYSAPSQPNNNQRSDITSLNVFRNILEIRPQIYIRKSDDVQRTPTGTRQSDTPNPTAVLLHSLHSAFCVNSQINPKKSRIRSFFN